MINLIYQDCYKCEPYTRWYEANKEIAEKAGLGVEPMAYYVPGAAALIKKAAKNNVGVPFFTDGKRFSKTVSAFIPKPKKTKKVNNDGADSED